MSTYLLPELLYAVDGDDQLVREAIAAACMSIADDVVDLAAAVHGARRHKMEAVARDLHARSRRLLKEAGNAPPNERTPPGEGGAPNIANKDIGTRNDTSPVRHPAVSPLDEATRIVRGQFPGTIDVTFNVRRETWSPIPWNATPLPGTARSPFDRRGFPKERGSL